MCWKNQSPSWAMIIFMGLAFFTMGFVNMAGVPIFPSLLKKELMKQFPGTNLTDHFESINNRMSYVMGSRCIVHLIVTPIWGILINKTGPVSFGTFGIIMEMLGCLLMAFGRTFVFLLIGKIIEGIGSSSTTVAALTTISIEFNDFHKRSCLIGLTSVSVVLGNYVSPLVSGALYENLNTIGQMILFYSIIFVQGSNLILHLIIIKFKSRKVGSYSDNMSNHGRRTSFTVPMLKEIGSRDSLGMLIESDFVVHVQETTPIHKVILDPFIDICILGIIACHLPHYSLLSTLSMWLYGKFGVNETIQGLVWLPSFIYNILTYILGIFLNRFIPQHNYVFVIFAFFVSGTTNIALAFASKWWIVMMILGNFAFTLTLVKFILLPLVMRISDLRHNSVHGSVAAIINESIQLAGAFSFFAAGPIINKFGFLTLNIIVAVIALFYCPLGIFLKPFCHQYN